MKTIKKCTAAALCVIMLLCGCGQKANTDSSSKNVTSAVESSETKDNASSKTSAASSKTTSSSASSKKKSDSEASSKNSSNKTTSSKKDSSSKKSTSSNSSKTASSKAETNQTTVTYTYEIGDVNDPIRKVEPEKVQQYIIEEEPIVVEPEPEATFENEYENPDPKIVVQDSWFDDCVFMGDSLSVGLMLYNDANGVFGDAKFVCASSLSYWNSQWDLYRPGNVHPMYNGRKVLLEDAVNLTGAKKAIITLGMNDIGIWGPEGTIDYARSLLNKIRAKSPDVKIYFETVSPMIYYAQKTHLNNNLIRQFNANLEQFAAEEGCGFLNSYEALSDSNGNLPYDFCSDPGALGLHLKFNGCAVWADFLKANVGTAYPGDEIIPETDTGSEEKTDTDLEIINSDLSDPEDVTDTSGNEGEETESITE